MGKLLNAVVKYPVNKIISTQYGERVNIVCTCGEDEITIWADANSSKAEQLRTYKKGDMVLVFDDNGKHKLLESNTGNTSTNSSNNGATTKAIKQNYEPLTDDKKREIGAFLAEQADLLAFCHECAYKAYNKRFPHDPMDESESFALDSETIQKAGMSLFITVQKRFGI